MMIMNLQTLKGNSEIAKLRSKKLRTQKTLLCQQSHEPVVLDEQSHEQQPPIEIEIEAAHLETTLTRLCSRLGIVPVSPDEG